MRSGPGRSYGVVEVLAKGSQVQILGTDSATGWLHVQAPPETAAIVIRSIFRRRGVPPAETPKGQEKIRFRRAPAEH